MTSILIAAGVSFVLSVVITPLLIKFFRTKKIGHTTRADGPKEHHTKSGTPTMGGIGMIVASFIGYFVAVIVSGRLWSAGGLLVMATFLAMGFVGFIDDAIKIHNFRNAGLSMQAKIIGQVIIGLFFSFGSYYVADTSLQVSFIGPIKWMALPPWFFLVCVICIFVAASNSVNLSDGLDGLASGLSAMALFTWVIIAHWIRIHGGYDPSGKWVGLYTLAAWNHADTVAMAAAAIMASCLGFLVWNFKPAKIFMGDTGSLALGGAIAALAVVTETELLLIIIGGVFVIEALSVIIQIGYFKLTCGKRIFRMTPIHHHFHNEDYCKEEKYVVYGFWLLGAVFALIGLAIFFINYVYRLDCFAIP